MKKRFCAFLMVSLISAMVCNLYADDSRIFALIKSAGKGEKYKNAEQVVIFDSTRVRVMDSGLSYVTMHSLIKVLKPAGALELACRRYDYDPLSAYVDVQAARIYRKNGTVETVDPATVLDVAAPARAIYWGARQKMVPVGRLEVGDALETIVFRKGFTYALLQTESSAALSLSSGQDESEDERYIPPMRGHFYDIIPFWSSVPVLFKTYTVTLPADKPLQYQFYNGEATNWVHFQQDLTLYHWEKKDIDPWKREPHMVAPTDVLPELLVSTSPDWYAKSLWFHKVNEDYGSFDVTPEVQEKTDQLIKDCKTDEEKVSVLTHWVAEEIRYSGLTMGKGEGYTLHKGEMTFADRCGVCKDKAGMLVTMLRAAGFESYPAMTMAGSRIDPIPADQFNHSVTLWKKKDGSYVLLDPTWVPGVRELWSSAEQQQQYLMGVPEGADLMTTPISPPENHYFNITGTSELSMDGTLSGSFTLEAEGQSDALIRRGMLRFQNSMWHAFVEQALFDIATNAEIIKLEVPDPYDLSESVRIEVHYRIPQYAQKIDDRWLFVPVVARHPFADPYTNSHLFMSFAMSERDYPFRTRCSKLIQFKEKIKLPSNLKVAFTPEFDRQQGNAADFSAEYQNRGNEISFTQTYAMKKRIYEADEWSNFRAAALEAKKVMERPVILEKK
ncbi:DUF3857 and transglutaminase domain-containing protein [candidate division KSB1 bacterium]|nr:DUF3857 and transglutaminase domain-containing protein [candidate division KSB1 bacterium]